MAPAWLELTSFEQREGPIHVVAKIAAVVDQTGRGLVRQLSRVDEVITSELGRIHSQLPGRLVYETLDQMQVLGFPGAAVGADRDGVGIDTAGVRVDMLDTINIGQQTGATGGGDDGGRRGEVGAHVGNDPAADGQEPPSPVKRQLPFHDVIACVPVRKKAIRAIAIPFHWSAQPARREGAKELLGIKHRLDTKGTAYVRGNDSDLGLIDPERRSQGRVHHAGSLGRGV